MVSLSLIQEPHQGKRPGSASRANTPGPARIIAAMASLTYHIDEAQYVAALRLHAQLRPRWTRWTRWLRYLMAILGVLIFVTSLLLKTY